MYARECFYFKGSDRAIEKIIVSNMPNIFTGITPNMANQSFSNERAAKLAAQLESLGTVREITAKPLITTRSCFKGARGKPLDKRIIFDDSVKRHDGLLWHSAMFDLVMSDYFRNNIRMTSGLLWVRYFGQNPEMPLIFKRAIDELIDCIEFLIEKIDETESAETEETKEIESVIDVAELDATDYYDSLILIPHDGKFKGSPFSLPVLPRGGGSGIKIPFGYIEILRLFSDFISTEFKMTFPEEVMDCRTIECNTSAYESGSEQSTASYEYAGTDTISPRPHLPHDPLIDGPMTPMPLPLHGSADTDMFLDKFFSIDGETLPVKMIYDQHGNLCTDYSEVSAPTFAFKLTMDSIARDMKERRERTCECECSCVDCAVLWA
jgi:hypothetical protein